MKHIYTIICSLVLLVAMPNFLFSQTITLSSPASSTTYVDNVPVVYAISGESGGISSISLTFTYTSGPEGTVGSIWTLRLTSKASSGSFTFNPSSVTSNTRFSLVTPASNMPDGVWSVRASYVRAANAATVNSNPLLTSISTDTKTLTPILYSPASDQTVTGNFVLKDSLREAFKAGSKKITFTSTSNTVVLNMANLIRKDSFLLNISDLTSSSSSILSTTGGNTLPDGIYTVTLQVQDLNSHPVATSTATDFNISSALPIGLSTFRGYIQNIQTHLLWKTSSESNSAFFDIEYSTDARNFSKVGRVAAAGDAADERNYQFTSTNPATGKNYYRLKMVDKDGAFKYSPIIVIDKGNGSDQFKVFPNPAHDEINLLIVTSSVGNPNRTINIIDMNGRIVKKAKLNIVQGTNLFLLSLKEVLPGNYLIQDGQNSTRFVKQ